MSHCASLHLPIDGQRLIERLSELAGFGGSARGGVAREALTLVEQQARHWLAARYGSRPGYEVGMDAAANLHIRRLGQQTSELPVMVGSHCDTQPLGGWLDGAFGVMAGLEVLDALDEAGISTYRTVEVVAWTNEEGSRFAPGLMGSQSYVQPLALDGFLPVCDAQGTTFEQARDAAVRAFEQAAREGQWHCFTPALSRPVYAYVEAHIEQGPVLERAQVPIGIVYAIQGVRWYQITVHGCSAHAGTTPLTDRDDAQAKAVALAHMLISDAADSGDADLRVTVGRWSCSPDSINTIANRVVFTIDVRHPQAAALQAFDHRLRSMLPQGTEVQLLQDRPTTRFAPVVVDVLAAAAAQQNYKALRMVSGAFHDAMPLAAFAPTAMLFAPSIGGISHHPDENTHDSDLVACAQVLADGLLTLAQSRQSLAFSSL